MPTVREASSAADFEHAASIFREYAQWLRDASGIDPFEAMPGFDLEIEDAARFYQAPKGTLFIAEHDSAVVGTVALRFHEDGSCELKRMFVRPEVRGLGAADRLISAALEHARKSGSPGTWLESKRGLMDRAIAVYRRNGFVETPEKGRTMVFDGVVVMELRFERSLSAA